LTTAAMMYSNEWRGYTPTWDSAKGAGWYTDVHHAGYSSVVDETLKYYGDQVGMGKLYPKYIKTGHVYYCPSPTAANTYEGGYYGKSVLEYGFKNMSDTKNDLSVKSSYLFRGNFVPKSYPKLRGVKLFAKKPVQIFASDMGWFGFSAQYGIGYRWINHPDRKNRPEFFNNAWTDGHVSSYQVTNRNNWPLVWNASARDGCAIGMDMMTEGTW